jgi:hypothetical protein
MIAIGALDEHIASDNGGTALDGSRSRDGSAQGADDEDDGGLGVHVDVFEEVTKIW